MLKTDEVFDLRQRQRQIAERGVEVKLGWDDEPRPHPTVGYSGLQWTTVDCRQTTSVQTTMYLTR